MLCKYCCRNLKAGHSGPRRAEQALEAADADDFFFLPGGNRRCLQTLTLSEPLSLTAGIALKSLDFVSPFIKEALLFSSACEQVFQWVSSWGLLRKIDGKDSFFLLFSNSSLLCLTSIREMQVPSLSYWAGAECFRKRFVMHVVRLTQQQLWLQVGILWICH